MTTELIIGCVGLALAAMGLIAAVATVIRTAIKNGRAEGIESGVGGPRHPRP